jgi:hypothetical protein
MNAKGLEISPINSVNADAFIKKFHYSGKTAACSQLHFGVFYQGSLEGCLQFGAPIDKAKVINLVKDTAWNGFLELNRMALSPRLPKNSESRALAVCMRLLRRHAPHVEWVLSYADGTQCGDGTIYRAAGFVLTGIKKNTSMWRMPSGEVVADISFSGGNKPGGKKGVKERFGKKGTQTSHQFLKDIGATCLPGFQLRYIYAMNPTVVSRLTVPVLKFAEIDAAGARMYRGLRPESISTDAVGFQPTEDGASPISGLQN